jgi:hypothetical protein
MADFRAITACCNAIVELFRSNFRREDFGNNILDFQVGILKTGNPIDSGITLSLYRIYPNANNRIPAGRVNPDGTRQKTKLPIDLHLLLTAWGMDYPMQLTVAGWMMRVLEDTPIFPANFLNLVDRDVFQQDETIEINIVELTNDDLFRIWEKLTDLPYRISVPYVVRNVRIESTHQVMDMKMVRERMFSESSKM